ncbi:MAG: hypothetical protein COX62_00780 [Deltaproteobacteria bacterium CG_4_10_14_0_2_um_filter_43_8]|nr:MAG: hypothetical protein COV43_06950 [Deltaproteobacteria bacterium CG11_big_fil_rev_8_21_14_0_20_42_23]PJA22078.1 MAG: hypothetical protein COX62_00780 [Deltaproteobacteria bacterium CG_4_10_14_0_2_um_filter_43_8]PJC65252.1 MAG: hypothetical protein CO021_00255 [Deltaproteobacteria bacterium CG_4_9_14_0_2_um_filter_42_21]
MNFKTSTKIRFHDADPAGIIFYAKVFEFAHNAFEDFFESLGLDWKNWFQNDAHIAPMRKASAEYTSPLHFGETYTIEVQVTHIGTSSFSLRYLFEDKTGKPCAVVDTTHVFVEKKNLKPTPMPEDLRQKLSQYLAA